ncbi:MAG: fimbrial protein [Lysobacterales bacterium 69-70]|nr:pilus assembly protein PilP [Xanthomonadaceae bacterium]ODU35265.1 MAG: fimbrial protein [Xanthomonadaceae bacterium SCN 69-320]ODV17269.1 MAG: fimbrial protein [Xanthomonadaceae bacterium SCN 69-25]OJY94164.1 MAG: fimbrial protein [Xanthomonadales bacterium 69-70]
MMKLHLRPMFVSALALLTLAGCTAGRRDLEDWVAAEKAKKGAPITPLPVVKTFETFEYKSQDVNGQEMRDPFSASAEERRQELAEVAGNGEGPDKSRPPELLEKYPLDGLSMVGTLGIGDAIEGLVKDPEGVVHRVHKDNYLGQNYGRITTIAEDRIELVELVPNGAGGWMERQASIALGDQ